MHHSARWMWPNRTPVKISPPFAVQVEALKQDRRRQMQEYEQAYATHRVVHSYWFKGTVFL